MDGLDKSTLRGKTRGQTAVRNDDASLENVFRLGRERRLAEREHSQNDRGNTIQLQHRNLV